MKKIKKWISLCVACCCAFFLSGCDSFYELFIDEDDTSSGVYYVIYNADSTDEEIASISDVSFMKSDLLDEISTYDLSFEITLAFDTETDSDATLTFYYYHNDEDEEADDYCMVGNAYIGTYVQEDDETIVFTFEPDGYNIALFYAGSDFASLEAFQAFSYDENGATGVWAYANVTYEYEDEAIILEDVIEHLPNAITFKVSGRNIVSWTFE